MKKLTRKTLIAAATLCMALATALPAQAADTHITGRVATAAGHFLAAEGNNLLEQVRKELAAGIQPKLQRLPTVTVVPTDEELRDAGIDPKQRKAAKAAR